MIILLAFFLSFFSDTHQIGSIELPRTPTSIRILECLLCDFTAEHLAIGRFKIQCFCSLNVHWSIVSSKLVIELRFSSFFSIITWLELVFGSSFSLFQFLLQVNFHFYQKRINYFLNFLVPQCFFSTITLRCGGLAHPPLNLTSPGSCLELFSYCLGIVLAPNRESKMCSFSFDVFFSKTVVGSWALQASLRPIAAFVSVE